MNVFVFFALQLGIVLFLGRLLSTQRLWVESIIWTILALLVFTAGIMFISSTNYGHELSDPIYYKNVAYFLAAHFQGYDVNFFELGIRLGKTNSLLQYDHSIFGQNILRAGEEYGSVALLLDTYHYLYSCYLALFIVLTGEQVELAIFGNAIFFAGVVQTLFILVQQITKDILHARLAVILLILDSGFLAVGAFLLRDLLVTYLLYLSILLISRSGSAIGWGRLVLILSAGCAMAALGISRYPAFFALLISVVVIIGMGRRVPNAQPLRYLAIAGVAVIGLLFSQLGSDILNSEKLELHLKYPIHIAKQVFYSQQIVQLDAVKQKKSIVADSDTAVVGNSESDAVAEVDATAVADEEHESTDSDETEDVEEKKIRVSIQFDRSNVENIIISLARTVFAPYPWSTLQVGFQGNWPELFIVEGLIWMSLLPFVFIYIPTILRSNEPAVWLMVVCSIVLFLAYSVTGGEYSTRQRLMSMPFLWFAVSGGLMRGMSWFKSS